MSVAAQRSARARLPAWCCRRWSTWPATRAGAASRRPTARIPTSSRELGVAAVRGYQGRTLPLAPDKVFATLKHFAGHGSHEGGINTAPALVAERAAARRIPRARSRRRSRRPAPTRSCRATTRSTACRRTSTAGCSTTCCAASGASRAWSSPTTTPSTQLVSRHHVAADQADAARQALEAGVDFELPDPQTPTRTLVDAVKDGTVRRERDRRRRRAHADARSSWPGLFENPYVDADEAERVVNTPEHQALALRGRAPVDRAAARTRATLLPLDRAKIKTLAVIGPNAKGLHLGGYSSVQPRPRRRRADGHHARKAGSAVKIVYAEGVQHHRERAELVERQGRARPIQRRTAPRIQEALRVAKAGGRRRARASAPTSRRRAKRGPTRTSATRPTSTLIEPAAGAGRRRASRSASRPSRVLINGRPLAIPQRGRQACPRSWRRGTSAQEGGTAIGEVLFGDVNPSGKLPVTLPRSVGQLPVYYNRKPTSFRDYNDSAREPLFAFGHGLSYTTFALAAAEGRTGEDQAGRRGDGDRRGHEHRQPGPATKSCSSTSATSSAR